MPTSGDLGQTTVRLPNDLRVRARLVMATRPHLTLNQLLTDGLEMALDNIEKGAKRQ